MTSTRRLAVGLAVGLFAIVGCQTGPAASGTAAPTTSAPSASVPGSASAGAPSASPSRGTAAACDADPGSGLVYYLAPMLSDEFQAGSKLVLEQVGSSLGYEVRTLNGNGQATAQVNQLDNAISQHPKAIIVAAVDSSTITTGVEKAKAAGIPVVVYDRFIKDTPIPFSSVTGTTKLGEIAADEAARLLTAKNGSATGSVLQILGDLGDQYTVTIGDAFKQRLAAQYPGITLTSKDSPGWTPEAAASITEDQIVAGHKPDLIFLHGDFRTPAVVAALQSRSLAAGDVLLIGTDGAPTGLAAIRDGWMTETVQQPMPQQACGIWKFMPAVIGGTAIAPAAVDIQGLPSEIKQELWGPTLYLPGQVIDKANVDDPTLWGNLKVVVQK